MKNLLLFGLFIVATSAFKLEANKPPEALAVKAGSWNKEESEHSLSSQIERIKR